MSIHQTPANTSPDTNLDNEQHGSSRTREIKWEHSREFVEILEHLGISLLVSTYQAGKLACIGSHGGQLSITFHNFQQAMGIAVSDSQIAIGTHREICFLRNYQSLATELPPAGHYDACFIAKSSNTTGNINVHDMAWYGDQLWCVNTLFSCLCTLDEHYSFRPVWCPKFISALAAEDRCHLNGLATGEKGEPRFVTMLGQTDEYQGWRPGKASGGCIMHVPSSEIVATGLSMPHSPRIYEDRLWVLDSGHGALAAVDTATGDRTVIDTVPGYTRGLSFHGQFAFVGLSKIRETNVFGGLPISNSEELFCGVAIIDLRAGRTVAWLKFHSGVEEVFQVQVLAGVRRAQITGPNRIDDGSPEVWLLPPLTKAANKVSHEHR